MQYEQLENDIVARLTPGFTPGVDVLALPETPEQYDKPFKNGRITVCYVSSKFEIKKSTNQASQYETPEFNIVVQAKLLRGPRGVYALIERIKSLLLGYNLTNTDRLFLKEQHLEIKEDTTADLFTFNMVVACQMLVVDTETPKTLYAYSEFE